MAMCGRCAVELDDFTEEEEKAALADYQKEFPDYPDSNKVMICDDCYQLFKLIEARAPWIREKQ